MTQTAARPSLLIIDDDDRLLASYAGLLKDEFRVLTARTGEAGLTLLQREPISMLLLEARLPGIDGLEVLRRAKAIDEMVDVIVITAVQCVPMAVEAIKFGAHDYLVKPVEIDQVLSRLRRLVARRNTTPEASSRRAAVTPHQTAKKMIGQSPAMHDIYRLIAQIAPLSRSSP